MEGWRGIRVRRIIAREIYSLRGVIPLFLASHTQPVELCLTSLDHAVTLAALPNNKTPGDDGTETAWIIEPSPLWAADFLGSIEKPASNRLTSLSVSFARLGALFCAQLNLTGVEMIEIRVGGAPSVGSDGPPVLSGEDPSLRVPSLRQVVFTFDEEYAHSLCECLDDIRDPLATLRESFRALISYDAKLLDAFTVSRKIQRECAGFAHLAKEYVEVQ